MWEGMGAGRPGWGRGLSCRDQRAEGPARFPVRLSPLCVPVCSFTAQVFERDVNQSSDM